MARILRNLLLIPLGLCLWRLWILVQREHVWALLLPWVTLLLVAVTARLVTPWIRALRVRASGKILLRRIGLTAGFACDIGLLMIFGALLWADRDVVGWLLVSTQLYVLWGLIALTFLSCVLAIRDVATLDRERSGAVILDDDSPHLVLSLQRVGHQVIVLTTGERTIWRATSDEFATIDTLSRWLREA